MSIHLIYGVVMRMLLMIVLLVLGGCSALNYSDKRCYISNPSPDKFSKLLSSKDKNVRLLAVALYKNELKNKVLWRTLTKKEDAFIRAVYVDLHSRERIYTLGYLNRKFEGSTVFNKDNRIKIPKLIRALLVNEKTESVLVRGEEILTKVKKSIKWDKNH